MCWRRKTKTLFGLKIDTNNVPGLPSTEAHEHALAVFIEECAKRFDEATVRKAVSTIVVEWWDKIAPRPSTGTLDTVVVRNEKVYSGLTEGSFCMVAWRGRFSRSAFCHELLHVVGRAVTGADDPDHTDATLWHDLEPTLNTRLTALGL